MLLCVVLALATTGKSVLSEYRLVCRPVANDVRQTARCHIVSQATGRQQTARQRTVWRASKHDEEAITITRNVLVSKQP
jgi:hypothetical protein